MNYSFHCRCTYIQWILVMINCMYKSILKNINTAAVVHVMQVISGTSEVTSTKTIEKKRMTLLEIYRKFYTDSIIDRLGNDCVSEDFIMGIRHTAIKSSSVESCKLRKTTTNHYMCVKKKYLMQAKAIQIGLIANEQQCESLKTLKENIEEIRQYFFVDTGVKPVGREIIERIISKCLFTKEYAEEVSKNFQSIIPHFNQSFFGGDEKNSFFWELQAMVDVLRQATVDVR